MQEYSELVKSMDSETKLFSSNNGTGAYLL